MSLRVKNFIEHPVSKQVLNLFWATNGDKVEYVTEGPADLAIFDPRSKHDHWQKIYSYPATINVCMDLAHAGSDKVFGWANYALNNNKSYVLLECRDSSVKSSRHLNIDFLFNRSKAYFVDKLSVDNSWYASCQENFELCPINPGVDHKTKLFLSPSKLLRPDLLFRIKLSDLIQANYNDLGYFSAIREHDSVSETKHLTSLDFKSTIIEELDQTFYGQSLVSQKEFPTAKTVKELCQLARMANRVPETTGYNPVHNAYYNETYFSVYCETIEISGTTMVTEKTLDPLIKGHFILPFGSAGTVADIERHGFRLPDFIDYSYDSIVDDLHRYYQFLKEFKRLAELSLDQWNRSWIDNQDILHYNRNIFFQRDYSRVNFKNLIESVK